MRALVTGQIGMDKKPYLESVAALAGTQAEQARRTRQLITTSVPGPSSLNQGPCEENSMFSLQRAAWSVV